VIPAGDSEAEDEHLARRVMAGHGDAEAEEALCRRLAPRVYAYARRQQHDAASAKDLVQDVLLLVLEKLRAGEVEAPARLASFALGVCRRVASDLRRGERRRQELLAEAAPWLGEVVHAAARPSSVDLARLAGCLDALGERERTVVVASFFADEPGETQALALGTSAGHVRVLRHRALRALRACLEGA
jgi:RNA polymerase sigma-70 factor (ECF subfamily)